jgi:hypothetical protein
MPAENSKRLESFGCCQGIETILIDATGVPRRPVDDEEQRDLYSGKKNDIL